MPYNRQPAAHKKFLSPPLPIYSTNPDMSLSHDLNQTSKVRGIPPSQPLRCSRVSHPVPPRPCRRAKSLLTSGRLNDQTQSLHFRKPILRSCSLSHAPMSGL